MQRHSSIENSPFSYRDMLLAFLAYPFKVQLMEWRKRILK